MCGIAGFWGGSGHEDPDEVTRDMVTTLVHRGPDDMGIWTDRDSHLGIGHRRLSIIDLSSAGHQPMISGCGRYVFAFNGEIYNHRELRTELELAGVGAIWRGHSDTESILALFASLGVEEGLKRVNGMFAFAFWDRQERQLYLGRDRMGEKPLYYGKVGNAFVFASELKALRRHPGWRGEIDQGALALYLRHNCVPAPYSIYRGIQKLRPGHYIVVGERSGQQPNEQRCYWDLRAIARSGANNRITESGSDLVELTDMQLRKSVRSRMEADVPLGAFLSGGVDSSTVVALMQAQSSRPVRTFSIGFDNGDFNEAEHAKQVAGHLGTEHTELYVSDADALNLVPTLPEIWDEPFSDSSQLPTCLVSRMAHEYVKVVLSGDGGDELFGGYNRYVVGRRILNSVRPIPPVVRGIAAKLMRGRLAAGMVAGARLLPARYRSKNLSDRLPKVAEVLEADSPESMYRQLISCWKTPSQVLHGAMEPPTEVSDRGRWPQSLEFVEQMMWLDQMSYLPDDILTKLDRASMAVSLEARVPLLDHELVEFSWRIPVSEKIKGNRGKCLLRSVLHRYVPEVLIERPKHGFGVPLDAWLRGPLREWGESLLASRRLEDEGYFDPSVIKRLWSEHQSGNGRWHHLLWNILMFQAWRDAW